MSKDQDQHAPAPAPAPADQHAPVSAPANQRAPMPAPGDQHAPASAPAQRAPAPADQHYAREISPWSEDESQVVIVDLTGRTENPPAAPEPPEEADDNDDDDEVKVMAVQRAGRGVFVWSDADDMLLQDLTEMVNGPAILQSPNRGDDDDNENDIVAEAERYPTEGVFVWSNTLNMFVQDLTESGNDYAVPRFPEGAGDDVDHDDVVEVPAVGQGGKRHLRSKKRKRMLQDVTGEGSVPWARPGHLEADKHVDDDEDENEDVIVVNDDENQNVVVVDEEDNEVIVVDKEDTTFS